MSEEEKNDNKKYSGDFTRIPNILFASYKHLTKEEKFLYCTLRQVYWDTKPRYVSLRELAELTQYSTGALSKMLPRLTLVGLIHAEIRREKKAGKEQGNAKYYITISDIWESNKRFYSCSPNEQVDPSEILVYQICCSPNEQTCSPNDTSLFTKTDKPVHQMNKFELSSELAKKDKDILKERIKDIDTVVAIADDASLTFSPSSNNNENGSHSEKLETNSQPQNSTTFPIPEPSVLPSQNVENALSAINSSNEMGNAGNGSQVAKQEASGEIRIADEIEKPAKKARKSKKVLDFAPTLPPARPAEDAPWSVEKCLAWGEYARKCVFAPSNLPQSKYYKSVEAAKKIIGQGITENTFLSVYLNWMKGVNLNLEALPEGSIRSETWLNYSVDLWVFIEHYEDEARKYKKAKLAQIFQSPNTTPIDLNAQREAARIKNLANLEKMRQRQAKQLEEQQAGKKRVAL